VNGSSLRPFLSLSRFPYRRRKMRNERLKRLLERQQKKQFEKALITRVLYDEAVKLLRGERLVKVVEKPKIREEK